jgi:hypothetical protein
MATGTAQNAKLIEIQMQAAAAYIGEALKAVRIASEAVVEGEGEAEFKLPEFSNLEGLLSIAFSTTNRTANNWSDYRVSREMQNL